MTDTTSLPASWHPDPAGQHQLRYWDGTIWTDHVSNDGVTSIAPLPINEYAAGLQRRRDAKANAKAARADAKNRRAEDRDVKQQAAAEKAAVAAERDAAKREAAEAAAAEKKEAAAKAAAAKQEAAEEKAAAKKEATRAKRQAALEQQEMKAQVLAYLKAEQEAEEKQRSSNPQAYFAGAKLRGAMLDYQGMHSDMTDATAEATMGAPSSRSTLTRMGAGVLLAGPAGLIVGAVARKNTTKCYVTIGAPDGVIVVEGNATDYPAAVRFADAVNRSERL